MRQLLLLQIVGVPVLLDSGCPGSPGLWVSLSCCRVRVSLSRPAVRQIVGVRVRSASWLNAARGLGNLVDVFCITGAMLIT